MNPGPTREDLQRTKEPLSPLAGPYGHPFHPIAVTLPIGAWSSSLVFDLLSRASDEPRAYTRGSSTLLKIGIAGALGAAFFGFMDYLKLPQGSPVANTATTHMALNLGVVGLYGLGTLERDRRAAREPDAPVSGGELGLSLLAIGLLGTSGWLGGMLSYHFGVRVADEATQAQGLPAA